MALPDPDRCEAIWRARRRAEDDLRLAEDAKIRAEQAWREVTDQRLATTDRNERARLNARQSELRQEIDQAARLIEVLEYRFDELDTDARFNQCPDQNRPMGRVTIGP